jgi:hypothetical protein
MVSNIYDLIWIWNIDENFIKSKKKYHVAVCNMINKINKERRRSMNATPKRSSNKSQWQGAQEDPKQKQDTAKGSNQFQVHSLFGIRASNYR